MDFGATTLKQLYANFGSEVKFILNPFVYGSADRPRCFDEASPCTLEQTSMCVIKLANGDQSKYVPWLVCMDSTEDRVQKCNAEVGVDSNAVQQCLKADAPALLQQYLKVDKSVYGTPTVYVNGVDIRSSWHESLTYNKIHEAICEAGKKAGDMLKGCSAAKPDWGDYAQGVSLRPSVLV